MKYKRNLLIVLILIALFIIPLGYNRYNKELITNTNNKISQNNGLLSIMLETNSGSGEYALSSDTKFPQSGYLYNETLSGCENGGILTYDKIKKKVILKNNISDKCYVYFDKVILPSIKVTSSSSTASTITVNVAGIKGSLEIAKYMYSINNKTTWVTKTTSATTSSHTFSGLNSNTEYTIYIKVVDTENNEVEISTKARTGIPATETIKKLYTSQGSNGIYYHDSSLTNGAKDSSYRYTGANPNNWVCFGTDATTCDDEHLYRIIGVFNNQLKLIKAYEGTQTSLGTAAHGNGTKDTDYYRGKLTTIPSYYWSGSKANESNNWASSTLNTNILNGTYLTKLGTKWTEKIATTEWKVGGNTTSNIEVVSVAKTYQREIVSPAKTTTYNAKIGLMYVSDYGYAVSPTSWTRNLSDYDYDTNRNNNWLYLGINEWFITPVSDTVDKVNVMSYSGFTTNGDSYYTVKVVRPTFYLESSVGITSGTGTETNPYRIA